MILSLLFEFIYGQVTFLDLLQSLIFSFAAILIAMTVHEFSHALAAYALGDKTAKADGRLSFNPLHHLDPWGLLLLLLFGFGWAKPVNINYSQLKHQALGPGDNRCRGTAVKLGYGVYLRYIHSAGHVYLELYRMV